MIAGHRANRILLLQSVDLGLRNSELMEEILAANQTLENKVRVTYRNAGISGLPRPADGTFKTARPVRALRNGGRGGGPGSVYFLDLNRFKRINDTLGHEAGDYVLREIALRLMDGMPAGALIARWGGDELVIVVPGAGEAKAVEVLENCSGRRSCFTGRVLIIVQRRRRGAIRRRPGARGVDLGGRPRHSAGEAPERHSPVALRSFVGSCPATARADRRRYCLRAEAGRVLFGVTADSLGRHGRSPWI